MSILKKMFGARTASPEDSLGVDAYTEGYASSVRRAHPGMPVHVAHGDTPALTKVSWRFPDGAEVSQFMGNWHARYLREPGRRQALYAAQLAEAREVRASFTSKSLELGRVLPVIKTVDWQRTTTLQLDAAKVPADRRPLSEPLVGLLVVAYVEDLDDTMDYVSPSHLQRLGMDVDTLRSHALQNLHARLPQLRLEGGGGRYAARLDRNYDASMVLFFEEWRAGMDLAGEPILAIAARDEVLVCGSADTAAVAGLRKMAAAIVTESAYGLSRKLFVWRDASLQPYSQVAETGAVDAR